MPESNAVSCSAFPHELSNHWLTSIFFVGFAPTVFKPGVAAHVIHCRNALQVLGFQETRTHLGVETWRWSPHR
jgi:hypothetical protein